MDTYDIHFRDINPSKSGEYSRDGAVDLTKWTISKPKILYVLKQTAGYERSLKGWSIVEELEREGGWLSAGNKAITYKRLPSFPGC